MADKTEMTEVEKQLLQEIRNYSDITFEDEDADLKVLDSIRRGICRFNDVAGKTLDYIQAGEPRSLLLEYCRYDRAGKRDEFERNYRSQIIGLLVAHETEDFYERSKNNPGNI